MVEIATQAIDQVSRFATDMWGRDVFKSEGVYSWTQRLAEEALASDRRKTAKFILYAGMKFHFMPVVTGQEICYLLQSVERVR